LKAGYCKRAKKEEEKAVASAGKPVLKLFGR
jgi:hypothetical protein